MAIEIIGAGAIGMLMASRIADVDNNIILWTRSYEQAEQINHNGIHRLNSDGTSSWISKVKAEQLSFEAWKKHEGERQLLLCVKQTHLTDELLSMLQQMQTSNGSSSKAVTLIAFQNGSGHMELLHQAIPNIPLHIAVTSEGARRLDGHTVQHTGIGDIWMSSNDERPLSLQTDSSGGQKKLAKLLRKAGITVNLSNQMNSWVYRKLMVNAVINPLTAIFDVSNGELPKHPGRLELMKALHQETCGILIDCGLKGTYNDWWQTVLQVCEQTSDNISSMLSDIRAGRRSEIEAINGAVLRLAQQSDKKAPLNRAMLELVQALQK